MYLHAGIELLTEENRERNVRWREMTGVEGGGAVFAIGCSAISVQKKLRKVLFDAIAAVVIVIEQYVRNVLGDDAKNWTIEFKDVQ